MGTLTSNLRCSSYALVDPYIDREQTLAKHFILRSYLQALAFKVLRHWDVAYVDGFSGPWKSETPDFSDSSFMIAIQVLKDAQKRLEAEFGIRRSVRCFFSESDPTAYRQLAAAVAPHNAPQRRFEVRTFEGKFESAVPEIHSFVAHSFPLIFIDPTGWTGYPFQKMAPLFQRSKCEVLINFMYSFVSRFITHPDPKITATLNPILGGPGWRDRLDPQLDLGPAVEKLFRESLQAAGNFAYVVSTRIDKSTVDRPHFFLAYGTKDRAGLKAFRETEYRALREHARQRSAAKTRQRESKTGTVELFPHFEADQKEASIDEVVSEQKELAKARLIAWLEQQGPQSFSQVTDMLLQTFMLRETNVKDVCLDLHKEGAILNTWAPANRKPTDASRIALVR
jgi:three-Cys-motif partner protein